MSCWRRSAIWFENRFVTLPDARLAGVFRELAIQDKIIEALDRSDVDPLCGCPFIVGGSPQSSFRFLYFRQKLLLNLLPSSLPLQITV